MQRRGFAVPGDVSVTGYDDSTLARMAHIELTTVGQRPQEQAIRAVRSAVERLDDDRQEEVSTVLRPRIVVRATTGPVVASVSG